MKKRHTLIVFLMAFCFIYTIQVFASRTYEPAKISPIIYKDIKIVAENNSPYNMGFVKAFDVTTNMPLWSNLVYRIKIKDNIEDDTQWVFIKEMKIVNDKLLVLNESNRTYVVDPHTGKVLNDANSVVIGFPVVVITTLIIVMLYINKKRKRIT